MPAHPDSMDRIVPLSAVERIQPESDGTLTRVQPASYLERWNTIFVAVGLLWILLVTGGLLTYYLIHLPPPPSTTGLSPAQVKDALDVHRQIYDQYRQSLIDMFDLLVTRTIVPIITLLLGYLFGKTPNRPG